MKFDKFAKNTFTVPMRKKTKFKRINLDSNRMKTYKKIKHHVTTIPPEKRSLKNVPKYADGHSKVTFQAWLGIDAEKSGFGKSKHDGKWYGWSHRAVYGFKVGDKVTGDSGGKKVEYPKYTAADVKAAELAAADKGEVAVIPTVGATDFDNGKYEPDFTIKTDTQAREVAMKFHDSVS